MIILLHRIYKQFRSNFRQRPSAVTRCLLSEGGREYKAAGLRDPVPNKAKCCGWPEGAPLRLIGGVPAQWNQFHVPLVSCKPRLDLCSDGEVFSTYGKIPLLEVSASLAGDKLRGNHKRIHSSDVWNGRRAYSNGRFASKPTNNRLYLAYNQK